MSEKSEIFNIVNLQFTVLKIIEQEEKKKIQNKCKTKTTKLHIDNTVCEYHKKWCHHLVMEFVLKKMIKEMLMHQE